MRTRTSIALMATTVLALALSGCSDNGGTTPEAGGSQTTATQAPSGGQTTGGVDPSDGLQGCELITDAEAAQALGISAPVEPDIDNDRECYYDTEESTTSQPTDFVRLTIREEAFTAQTQEDIADWLSADDEASEVQGLGDAAVATQGETLATLTVWTKGYYLSVEVQRMDESVETMPLVEGIVNQALSRMP
jgi:hypothetical protein